MSGKYEELRLQNLKDNQRILAEIGLVNPFKKLPKVTFKKAKRSVKRKAPEELQQQPRKLFIAEGLDDCGSIRGSRRRSARIQGKDAATDDEIKQEVQEWEEDEDRPKPVPKDRPNFYGAVPGVEVGTTWLTRMECCRDGIHRPTVAGIHGGPEGAYSIALSGGYDDNVDLGEGFTYTGEGGRDLKGTKNNPKNLRTAPQSKDQTLTRGNLALSKNVETKQPVRVIRGYKLNSPFAPEDGYRYDGMYSVEKAWFTTGLSGFGVWKFALRRCADQAPPPWSFIEDNTDKISETGKSDSGFDSDETGSHMGSQDSDDGSEKQEMKESDEESGLNQDEKEESATVDDKKDEDADQQEDVSDACN